MSTRFSYGPQPSSSCINWHAERSERNQCLSKPRTGVKEKYAALRQGVPDELCADHFNWAQKQRIGSGGFGSVSSVPLLGTGFRCAVKKDKRPGTYNREVAMLEYITGDEPMPYATQLLGAFHHELPNGEIELYSVQPLFNRSLVDDVYPRGADQPGVPLDPTVMYKNIVQLTIAIAALQREEVMHRDIKLENIMISDEGDIRLIDFGLAYLKPMDDGDDTTPGIPKQYGFQGTECYMAPEILDRQYYDGKVDVWALGVMIYEMGCGTHPFVDEVSGFNDFKAKYRDPEIPVEARERYGDEWAEFVLSLLSKRPHDRPAASELYLQPYLAEISENMWVALSEPYANTEYLLGIQLPNAKANTDMGACVATSPMMPGEWTSQPSASFIAALEVTPRPAFVPCFDTSDSAISTTSRPSIYLFQPRPSMIVDYSGTLDYSWSEESTPDPSPLFTPAERGSECDPFNIVLDQDMLDLNAVSDALQEAAEVVDKAADLARRRDNFDRLDVVSPQ